MYRAKNQLEHFQNAVFVTLAYLAALSIVKYATNPIELVINSNLTFASLMFFPHGIRVVSTLIFGPTLAFLYLVIAGIAALTLSPFSTAIPLSWQVIQLIIGAACAPVAFLTLSFLVGKDQVYIVNVSRRSWRYLFLAILTASVLNAIGQALVVEYVTNHTSSLKLMLSYLFGDITGAMVCVYLTYLLIKRLNI